MVGGNARLALLGPRARGIQYTGVAAQVFACATGRAGPEISYRTGTSEAVPQIENDGAPERMSGRGRCRKHDTAVSELERAGS